MPQGGHPPHHSITSSARASSCGGTSRPSDPRTAQLFSLRSAELSQRFFIQGPNLSQVPLGFFNGVPDGVQPLPDRNLASIIQRGFEALEAECGKNGEGISLLYSFAG